MAEKVIKRDIYDELWRDLGKKEFAFLIGPRQAGKTTLMKQLQGDLQKRGEKTLFLSLDFEHDRVFFDSQQAFLRKVELEMGKKKGFVFIDEVQRKEDAGLFLKGLYDMGLPYKFIVSGSGSVDLKAKIKESLAGRKRVYDIHTISLKEFINFKTDYRYEDNLSEYFTLERGMLDQLLVEYLNFGGYPRVVLEVELREKIRIIDEIYHSYIEKDITYLLKVEKIEAFRSLIKVLADQTGQLLNYSELSNTIGISLPTLKNYLWYAENTYILERVTPYFRNIRSEISKSPIVYFSDIGLRNYSIGLFGGLARESDMGFAFQNLVFSILREKLRGTNAEIHYWRTKSGAEIDFVIDYGRDTVPVEVKYKDLSKPAVPRSFEGFIEKYAPARCMIINKSLKATVKVKNTEVVFLTAWDLILKDL